MLLLTSFVVKQVPSPTPPEMNATRGPVQQPPGMTAPNMSASRPQPMQPPPPFAPASRGFPPQQAPNAPPFPRPPPGVQWNTPAPPQGQPLRPEPDSPREVSAIDKKWGVLFDRDGIPTKRWDQVVRGIGNYLVSILSGEKEYQLTMCCRWMSLCRRIR